MKRNYYVYLTWDTEKNKFYLGKRSTTRNIESDPYVGSGNVILNIKRRYKDDKEYLKRRFVKVVLEISSSEEENAENEIKWCEFFNVTENEYFYNIAGGGTGGHTIAGYTEEQRKKFGEEVSKRNKGKFTGEKNPMYGKGMKGKDNPMYGKPSWNKGKKPKPEWIEKISGANSPHSKKVMLVNTGEIFSCAKYGAERLGIHKSGIWKCCNGKTSYAGKVNGEKAIWRWIQ